MVDQRRTAGTLIRKSLICASIIGLIGCSQITSGSYNGYQGKARDAAYYTLAKQYYFQGDYEQSLEQSLAIISEYPLSPVYDKALFYAGLNSLHVGSPRTKHRKAIDYFKQLVKECPNSSLKAESNTWITVLKSLSLKDKQTVALKRQLREKKNRLDRLDGEKAETIRQLREEMELRIKRWQRKKNREIARMKHEIEKLKSELEMSKKDEIKLGQ
jgi:tetratricopeptide (TPR) repeat protein